MKIISIIIPVFNEARSIQSNLQNIVKNLPFLDSLEYEILVINDGSTDQTKDVLKEISQSDPRVQFLCFTRNFGKEAAIIAGLMHSKGHCVIVMDSDLQHPPELLTPMINYWQKGFLVVEGVKENRGIESWLSRLCAKCFYYFLKKLSGFSLSGHSDFKLLDREVVKAYLALPEKQRFFRALVLWLGYVSVQIPFTVGERGGDDGSRWSQVKLIRYALKNIAIFSSAPLSFVSVLGVFTLLFGFFFGVLSLWQKFQGQALTGFTTVNLLIIIMGGSILLCLGIVGHYLALIYDEIKARPQFVLTKNTDSNDFNSVKE